MSSEGEDGDFLVESSSEGFWFCMSVAENEKPKNDENGKCGKCKTNFLDQVDLHVAHLYVLQNCPEVELYLE